MEKLQKSLNVVVSDLQVFFVKLHHYHWYVKGSNFFALHEKFEEYYNEVNELYDEFAERLLTIGGKPASTLKEYLTLTTLKEETEEKDSAEMVEAILHDFLHIAENLKAIIDVAQGLGDEVTADLCISTIAAFEKHAWMLKFYLNN